MGSARNLRMVRSYIFQPLAYQANRGLGTHVFVLQKMPDTISVKTTCGYPDCSNKRQIFGPGCHRLSLEPRSGGFDDHGSKITTSSIKNWKAVRNSTLEAGHHDNLRGKAVRAIEWYCLACIEHLWARPEEDDTSTVVSSTLTAALACISEHIFPERRMHPLDEGRYKLSSPEAYAVEKWKAAIAFLDFVAVDGKIVDMLRFCEMSNSISQWGTNAYPGREHRLLYTSEALRDARGKVEIGGVTVRVEVARRHVKGKALSSILKLVEEKMGDAAANGTKGAKTAGDPNKAKAVVDKDGPPLRKKRRLRLWPFGPENGEKPSESIRSWKSTWSDEEVAKPTETSSDEKQRPRAQVLPPPPTKQAPQPTQRGWGPGSIENIYEVAVHGEGLDESRSGYNVWTRWGILEWYEGARGSRRMEHPCTFNVRLDRWE